MVRSRGCLRKPVPCHHRADLRPQLLAGVLRRGDAPRIPSTGVARLSLSGCPDATDRSSLPSTSVTLGAFGLPYSSGSSGTKGSNGSACWRKSTENGSCFSGVTASSGAHRTSTFPAELPIGTAFSRRAGTPASRSPSGRAPDTVKSLACPLIDRSLWIMAPPSNCRIRGYGGGGNWNRPTPRYSLKRLRSGRARSSATGIPADTGRRSKTGAGFP